MKYKIAFYIRTDIQHIPPILPLFNALGGLVITKTAAIYDHLCEKLPENKAQFYLVRNSHEARKILKKHDIKIVVYTGFQNLSWGYSVQVFHGVSDKTYIEDKRILSYDRLFLPGRKHYDKLNNCGLIRHQERIQILGYPKFDKLINSTLKTKSIFNNERKTILYAPTWITDNSNPKIKFSSHGESSLLVWGKALVEAIAPHWNLIIKYHSRLNKNISSIYQEIEDTITRLDVGDSVKTVWDSDITPYMQQSDLMISDISAVCYEWFHLNRPIVFANPAVDYYRPSDDPYSNTYAWRAGDVLYKESDIVPTLQRNLDFDNYQDIRNELLNYSFYQPDGRATERQVQVLKDFYHLVEDKNWAEMIFHNLFRRFHKI